MSNNGRSYGYYGKGTTGYVHYMQDFNRGSGHGGGGGGNNGGCGCFTLCVVGGLIFYAIMSLATALMK